MSRAAYQFSTGRPPLPFCLSVMERDEQSGHGCLLPGAAKGSSIGRVSKEPVHEQDQVSTTDPDSTYATKGGTPARLGYYDNYLVANQSCVIVGVQATAARMSQETVAAQDMIAHSPSPSAAALCCIPRATSPSESVPPSASKRSPRSRTHPAASR